MVNTVSKLVIAILLVVGCTLNVDAPRQTVWEANLSGSPAYVSVSGSAAAVANEERTAAGVTVTGLGQGTYAWRIREGDCGVPGAVLGAEGAYPDITVEPEQPDPENPEVMESVSAQTLIGAPMLEGRRYHATVLEPATGDPVACGDFVQQ